MKASTHRADMYVTIPDNPSIMIFRMLLDYLTNGTQITFDDDYVVRDSGMPFISENILLSIADENILDIFPNGDWAFTRAATIRRKNSY